MNINNLFFFTAFMIFSTNLLAFKDEGKILDNNAFIYLKTGKLERDGATIKNPKVFAEYQLHKKIAETKSYLGATLTNNGRVARMFQTGIPYKALETWIKTSAPTISLPQNI